MHSFLQGSKLCTASNSSLYLATLLKTATYYSPEPASAPTSPLRSSSTPNHTHKPTQSPSRKNRRSSSRGSIQKLSPSHNSSYTSSKGELGGSPILSRQSRIRPLTLPTDARVTRKPVKRVSPSLALSPGNRLHPFFPAAIDGLTEESDYSGYDADTEFGGRGRGGAWWSEGGTPVETVGEEDKVAGSGCGLYSPISTVKVPGEVKRRLWLESPVWQCLELLKECIDDKRTRAQW